MRRLAWPGAAAPALLAAGLGLLAAASARADGPASVSGRVSVGVAGVALADAGPIVVYSRPWRRRRRSRARGPRSASISRASSRASPVVPPALPVAMPNDDTIFHNVFSYSKPNDFDSGCTARARRARCVSASPAGADLLLDPRAP